MIRNIIEKDTIKTINEVVAPYTLFIYSKDKDEFVNDIKTYLNDHELLYDKSQFIDLFIEELKRTCIYDKKNEFETIDINQRYDDRFMIYMHGIRHRNNDIVLTLFFHIKPNIENIKIEEKNNMRIVLATNNEHKVKELREILISHDSRYKNFEIISMKEAGVEIEVEETGTSLLENAILKAEPVADILKDDIVIADDSGLFIDFYDGKPGIYSHRFMGDVPYMTKMNRIISDMEYTEEYDRGAHYKCSICVILPNKTKICTDGKLSGKIHYWISKGKNGFAYDAIFVPEGYEDTTLADMTDEEKNAISHRRKAIEKLSSHIMGYINTINE